MISIDSFLVLSKMFCKWVQYTWGVYMIHTNLHDEIYAEQRWLVKEGESLITMTINTLYYNILYVILKWCL